MAFIKGNPVDPEKVLIGDELVELYSGLWHMHRDPKWYDRSDLVRFVLGTGARVSEIPGLRIPEDCTERGVVHIRNSKRGRSRSVRVTPELWPYYQERLAKEGPGLLFPHRGHNGHAVEGPYYISTFKRWWNEVLWEIGIRHVSIHAGRHTYASHEIGSKRMQPHEVQRALGHRKVDMTLDTYTQALAEYQYQTEEPAWRSVALNGAERRLAVVRNSTG